MGLSTRSFALLAFLTLSLAAKTSSTPTTTAAASATSQAYSSMTSEGCYSSSGDMTDQGSFQWQSSLHCQEVCVALNKPVLGLTGGGNCWCGDLLPAASAKVADSQCSTPCNGYPSENCGGSSTWTIWLDGLSASVGSVDGNSTSSSTPLALSATSSTPTTTFATSTTTTPSTSTTAKTPQTAVTTQTPQVVTVSGSTIVRTVQGTTILATATASSSSSSSSAAATQAQSTNKAAVAAGAVVGVVALVGLVAGVYFFLRRRRVSSHGSGGHRRTSSITAWSGAPVGRPTLPRLSTLNDSRLDPRVLNEKRKSGVSIFADNEDYSRRILKVTNPEE